MPSTSRSASARRCATSAPPYWACVGARGWSSTPEDPDTWSTGSFFTNPVVAPEHAPKDAPAWPQPDGLVKVSAAWLIEAAGFAKGYGAQTVGVSSKHTLALTNRVGPPPLSC